MHNIEKRSKWSNWSGNVTCQPQRIETPTNEDSLIALISQTQSSHRKLRVAGTGHSFVPLCASDEMIISLDKLQGVITTDVAAGEATVWAGTKIHQLGEPLHQAGLAMETMGDIDRQSIAGAVSTGTHGTGPSLGSISTQVIGLRLILASGEILECSADQAPDIFKAAQVSLGALSVISQIRLRVLPTYRIHEKTWVMPLEECVAEVNNLIAQNRHFEFFWLPQDDVCAMKTLNITEAEPQPVPQSSQLAAPGTPARYVGQERIDHSYKIIPSERNNRFNETEFAVPEAQGLACFLELRQLMRQHYPDVVWPIEYRTLKADDIYLSPAYQRATVTLSVHEAYDRPYQAFFADVEAIFRNYQGRPHWGKLHTHRAAELEALYPQWKRFQTIREQLDPQGRLMNKHLQMIFIVNNY